MPSLTLIAHNVRSTHNVGSILRTAACAGIKKVYLCGTTPTPVDRFGRKRNDVAKVALGAEDMLSWEWSQDTMSVIRKLQQENVSIVALEQDSRAVPYTAHAMMEPTALIVGEEVHGIPKAVLDVCDSIIEIPMVGKKESLNVSVATGIAVFRLLEQGA